MCWVLIFAPLVAWFFGSLLFFEMEHSSFKIEPLTPHNYHIWKPWMLTILAQRGLNTLIKEQKFTFKSDYETWSFTKATSEAFGLIKANVSESLWFHLDNITTPHDAWDKLESLFSKVDTMRAMQIDAQLTALSLDDFPTMVDYLTKFKELHIQLMGVGKKKKEDECIYLILSKLKGPFHVFASTFLSLQKMLWVINS